MRFSSLIHERIQELAAKLPTQRNREFFERIMEIFRVTGNSRAKTEIRPRTNIFTIRDFDDGAFVDAVAFRDSEPAFSLAGFLVDLFPTGLWRWAWLREAEQLPKKTLKTTPSS